MKKILVPRVIDQANTNAQVLNARAMLARFVVPEIRWVAPYYDKPDPEVLARKNVTLRRLMRRHLWYFNMLWNYQMRADAIFYAGACWFDHWGLRLRDLTGRKIPVIANLEGLVGDADREQEYSEWAEHPVFCQRVGPRNLKYLDELYRRADHVIAISPFLGEMGRRRYGNKFSVIPLGIDDYIFYSEEQHSVNERLKVVSAGNMHLTKRVGMFLELAKRHPEADFIWFGGQGSSERTALLRRIESEAIPNLSFPGNVQPTKLAEAFRSADLFVMPSVAEGVPRVTQEAAACGLPVVIFGYYEAHSVVDAANGYVVWDDDQFYRSVAELLADSDLRACMGVKGATMALDWSWDAITLRWEEQILEIVDV